MTLPIELSANPLPVRETDCPLVRLLAGVTVIDAAVAAPETEAVLRATSVPPPASSREARVANTGTRRRRPASRERVAFMASLLSSCVVSSQAEACRGV
jgi:hypothetical protein